MSAAKAITCPHCNAPLPLYGGGRVQTITCLYCHSMIDLEKHNAILHRFVNIQRPDTPFKIGMKGELEGISYTIIGLIEYIYTEFGGGGYVDFLLFSPLYGYAWLSDERGHLTFSKRSRNVPHTPFVEIGIYADSITIDDIKYQYLESYKTKIIYVEGELTWKAKKGDITSCKELVAAPLGLSIERTSDEIEWYKSHYLDPHETYTAFSIETEEHNDVSGFHPLKPFYVPLLSPLSQVSGYLALLFLLFLGLLFWGTHTKNLLYVETHDNQISQHEFNLTSTAYLTSITIRDITNPSPPVYITNLNDFKIRLTHNDRILFTLDKQEGLLFSDDTHNTLRKKLFSWENSAKEAVAYIKLDQTGIYKLLVVPEKNKYHSKISITVKQEVVRGIYLYALAILFAVSMLLYLLFWFNHRRKLSSDDFDYEEGEDGALFGVLTDGAIYYLLFFIYLIWEFS